MKKERARDKDSKKEEKRHRESTVKGRNVVKEREGEPQNIFI